ncbi:MAG: SIMPL domain-containing protein [Alphaproteobacteria bacterium]
MSDCISRFSQTGIGICIALGLIVSSWIVSNSWVKISSSKQTIDVKGFAERSIKSELASWDFSVRVRNADLSKAYEELEEKSKQIMELLVKENIANNIETDTSKENIYKKIRLEPTNQYGRIEYIDSDELDYYKVTRTFSLKLSRDVDSLPVLIKKIKNLIPEGFDIGVDYPEYFYPSDKLNMLRAELISEASQNAYDRAKRFAKNTDSSIVGLMSARQGVFQIMAPLTSSDASNYGGSYNTSSIEKVVKVVVTMDFHIK